MRKDEQHAENQEVFYRLKDLESFEGFFSQDMRANLHRKAKRKKKNGHIHYDHGIYKEKIL